MLALLRPLRSAFAGLSVFVVGLAAQTSHAQDTEVGLEEVTVSATRRTETDIQRTPISVSAISDDDLARLTPRDIRDVAIRVPSLISGNVAGFNAASFGLRGVGQTSIIVYQEAPVGVTVDDFVLPNIQGQVLDTFDIESVEVLRGPQGTLFGKNTTAGVINIRTKRPDLEAAAGELQYTVGSFQARRARGAVNLPITDTFAVRLAGGTDKSDGYFRNGKRSSVLGGPPPRGIGFDIAGDGSKLGGEDSTSGRLKALWQPNDRFNALLQFEYLRDRRATPPIVNETPADPGLAFHALGFTGVTSGDPLRQAGVSNRDDGLKMGNGHRVSVDGAYLNLEWKLSDSYTLYSSTGRREQKSRLPSTYTGEVFASLFDATRDDDRETTQQELRIASDLDGKFNFVAGAYYAKDETKFCVLQYLGFLDFFGPGFAPNTLLANAGLPTLTVNSHNANPSVLCNRQDGTATAVFGDATYDLTDRWTLGLGARWTREKKEWAGRSQIYPQFLNGIANFSNAFTIRSLGNVLDAADFARFPINVVRDQETWTEPTWRATLSYQATDDVFAWATYARGFKSGAYNDQTGTSTIGLPFPFPAAAARPVNPEIADSIELGLKTDLLNNRLRINGVVYRVKYDDAQRELVGDIPLGGGLSFQETRFFNAAELTVNGVELEIAAKPIDSLTLYGNAAYTDAKFDRFQADTDFNPMTQCAGCPPGIDVDRSGSTVPRTPEWMARFGATLVTPLRGGALEWDVNGSYEGENIHVPSTVPESLRLPGLRYDGIIDARTLYNASVTWRPENGAYHVRLFGRNLGDERYREGVLPVGNLWTMASYGPPRQWGLEFGVKFGGEPAPAPRKIADSDGDGVTDDLDRCPGTPPGTAVDPNGCPVPGDADRDGVSDDRDRCPNTPAGARVGPDGCELDADGDGVVDRLDQCPGTPAGTKVDAKGCELDSDADGVVDSRDRCPDTPRGDRVDVYGCSFTTEIKLPGVVFATDKAELLDSSRATLDDAAATLKRYPDLRVEVAGHTDSVGSDAYNLRLSRARAESVLGYLRSAGVTNELTARGYGERQPIADNGTEEGRQANRRVVLRVLGM